jgi:branched-chain amino acid transport system substrate-binding protein
MGIVTLLLVSAGCGSHTEPGPVRIGHVEPALPADPGAVRQARRGIRLAVEEFGGELRDVYARPASVLHPDCRPDRDAVRAAASRLTSVNKVVALLGGTDHTLVDALVAPAQSADIPVVAAGGNSGVLGDDLVFHVGLAPSFQGERLGAFAAKAFPGKAMVLWVSQVENDVATNRVLTAGFRRAFCEAGGRIAAEWGYESSADLKDLARRPTPESPAAVFLAGPITDLIGLRQAGVREQLPILFGGPDGALAPLKANPLPNPVYLATAFAVDHPAAAVFVRRFEGAFHEAPDVHAALAYDSARLLLSGLRRIAAADGPGLRAALAEIREFDSTTGPLTIDTDHWSRRTAFILQVENGKVKSTSTYGPDRGP